MIWFGDRLASWQCSTVETALGYDSEELGFSLPLTSSLSSTPPFCCPSQCQEMFTEAFLCAAFCARFWQTKQKK